MATWEEEMMAEIAASRDGGNEAPPVAPVQVAAEPPQTPEAAPVEASAPPPEPAPEKPRFSLDDVILDDPDLPDTLRGKPARALREYALDLKHRHDQAGFQKNATEAELRVTQKALEVLQKFAPAAPSPQPTVPLPPQPSAVDLVRQRIDPKIGWEEPDKLAAAAAEVGAEVGEARAREKLQPKIDEIEARLNKSEADSQSERKAARDADIRKAYLAAKPDDMPMSEWDSKDQHLLMSGVLTQMEASGEQIDVTNPATFTRADRLLMERASSRIAPVNAAPPTPAPAPASAPPAAPPAPVAPPPPPVGSGKVAAPPQTSKKQTRLDSHTRTQLDKLGERFGLSAEIMSEIEESTINDSKYRNLFQ